MIRSLNSTFSDLRFSMTHRMQLALVASSIIAAGLLMEDDGYNLRIATLVLLFGGMASAWNVIGGYANQTSMGHAAFFGVGAYAAVLLYARLGVSPWLGLPIAAALGALLSVAIGLPTFRLRGQYYALATLAFAEVLRIIALYFRDLTGGPVGLSVPYAGESFWAFQFSGSRVYYFIAAAMLAAVILVTYCIDQGRLGYQLRALRDSHEAAEAVGVGTRRAKLIANAWSAAFMSMYGVFYAQLQFFIDPDTVFGFWTISAKVALIAILGGLGTVWGPMLGALVLVPLDEVANATFTGNLAAVSRLAYGSLLIALILFQPRGLLGWAHSLRWTRPRVTAAIASEGRAK